MAQQDTSLVKNQIMKFIEEKGPSLPTHVASETGQSMLFSSAFLAELLSEKKLVLSYMKVGSSPIYFISGQELLLEKYSVYLSGKLGEAYTLIKEKKYLKDSEQLPAIRVALRSIKDFAKPFRFKEDIYWRYLANSVDDFLSENNKDKKKVLEQAVVEKVVSDNDDLVKGKKLQEEDSLKKEEDGKSKIPENTKGDVLFVERVRKCLEKENIVILEETEIKKREFLGRGRIQSGVGEIEILVVGKDKKNILEKDIEKIMQEAINKKMMVLVLSTGEIAKKAKDIYREYKNLIRFIKI